VEASAAAKSLHVKKARESLRRDFADVLSGGRIDQILDDSLAQVDRATAFDDYVPALAERLARERLRAAARSAGTLAKDIPEVLFLALHDTGRGQMGAAIMRSLAGERVSVHSAGTSGGLGRVDPGVVSAMHEIGIDLDQAYSKPLTLEVLAAADIVVTMGRSTGVVQIPPGTRHVDWRIGDPGGGAPIDEIRSIRDDIRARVLRLLAEIAGDRTDMHGPSSDGPHTSLHAAAHRRRRRKPTA
jgi:arsenate reductase (thioredoxin)